MSDQVEPLAQSPNRWDYWIARWGAVCVIVAFALFSYGGQVASCERSQVTRVQDVARIDAFARDAERRGDWKLADALLRHKPPLESCFPIPNI